MDRDRVFCSAKLFLRTDEGLVALEWVAMAAAVIVLGIGVVIVLKPSVNTAVDDVATNFVSSINASP